MRNTLGDLNNHLFAQLERLNDEELAREQLEEEIQRSKAITSVASQIISNGELVLQSQRYAAEYHGRKSVSEIPKMLEG